MGLLSTTIGDDGIESIQIPKAFSQIKLRSQNLFGKGFDNGLRKVYTRHYSIVTNMHVSYQRFGSKDAG